MAISKRRRLFERGEAEHALTLHQVQVLRLIGELGICTVPQLAGFSGSSLKAIRDHVSNLFHLGLVERIGVPRAALADLDTPNSAALIFGRSPVIYCLSRQGAKLLGVQGHTQYTSRRSFFLAHELGIRAGRVWLEKLKREYGHEGVTLWRHGAEAALGGARPDAVFVYRFRAATLSGLLEIDRGTERSPARWQDKVAKFAALFASGALEETTGHKRGRVIVIAPNERRRDAIARVIYEQLPKTPVPPDRFWLTSKDTLERTDLRAALWRIPGADALRPLVSEKYL